MEEMAEKNFPLDLASCVDWLSGAFLGRHATSVVRPVVVAGPAASGKSRALRMVATRHGWPVVNASLVLAQALVGLPSADRAGHAGDALADAARAEAADAPVLLVDDLELLFDAVLRLNPVQLLIRLARSRRIVAAWPGLFDGRSLSYAEQGHPDHRLWPAEHISVLALPPPPG